MWYNKSCEGCIYESSHIYIKNSESFYIAKSYAKANGSTTSTIVRKLGSLNQLLIELGPTRDDVLGNECNFIQSVVYKNSILPK